MAKRMGWKMVREWVLVVMLAGLGGTIFAAETGAAAMPYRWFYTSNGLRDNAALRTLKGLIDTASAHNYNGVVLATNFSAIDRWSPKKIARLKKIKTYCDAKKMALIPLFLSVGYGGGTLIHDWNMAAGIPVRGVLYQVKNGVAKVVPETPLPLSVGGFEHAVGDRAKGLKFQDKAGKFTFIDSTKAKSGKHSLRLEGFTKNRGRVRIQQTLTKKNRHYILRFWAKCTGLKKPQVTISLYNEHGQIVSYNPPLKNDTDWQKIEIALHTVDFAKLDVWIGSWSAKSGKIWLDDLEIVEAGMVNLLRRAGTPFSVTPDGGGKPFIEGVDFERVVDTKLRPREAYHAPPPIQLKQGGRIQDGARLRVSYYTSPYLRKGQTVACMSTPKIYTVWKRVVGIIEKEIQPKIWFLDMDEIRGGGTCATCRARRHPDGKALTPGEILGDCITRQVKLIKTVSPLATVAIWSDMLDPNHNAREYYYTVPGGYVETWKYIPKELIIACWYLKKSAQTLPHFSRNGFRTLAAAYYDADDLAGSKEWLGKIRKTPKGVGMMYTSWENKYKLLAPFGDLIAPHGQK